MSVNGGEDLEMSVFKMKRDDAANIIRRSANSERGTTSVARSLFPLRSGRLSDIFDFEKCDWRLGQYWPIAWDKKN